MTVSQQRVSRRAVVAGTSWAVPAVLVGTAAPAVAASPSSCIAVTLGANSCTQLSDDRQTTKGYRLQLCFANVCNVPSNVHVTGIQLSPGSPVQDPDLRVRVPRESSMCADILTYCTGVITDAITVSFTANPGAPLQVRSVPAPPACPPGTAFCPA